MFSRLNCGAGFVEEIAGYLKYTKGDMKIIGISGGSGSGKSSLAISLLKKHPNECAILHIDDYFKKKEDAPKVGNFTDWDHPDSVRFDDLYRDLLALKEGRPVTILTKSELYHPDYDPKLRNKIEYVVEPRQTVIVEGHLVLSDERIRDLMDVKVYLDMPIEESIKRQSGNRTDFGTEYFDNILGPRHRMFVEPGKEYADIVLDVSELSSDEALEQIELSIFPKDRPGERLR